MQKLFTIERHKMVVNAKLEELGEGKVTYLLILKLHFNC
jgi:hypothetical protein